MKLRRLAAIAGCILLGGLAACGNSGGEGSKTASSEGKVNITFFNGKVEINDALQAAVDTYMDQNPDIHIELETVGGGSDTGAALKTKLNSGNMPTIFGSGGPQSWLEWGDYLEDLSDQPWVEHVSEAALTMSSLADGTVVGLPYSVEGYGYVYNKNIFEAAGIDGESLKSYEEIDDAFAKLKDMIDNGELADEFPLLESVMEFPVKETWVTGLHTVNLALNQEFGSENEVFDASEVAFTYGDQLKEIIDFQVKYTGNAENPSGLTAVDYSVSIGGGLAIERVAVVQQGNWINAEIAAVNEELADSLGIIPIPLNGVSEGKLPVGVPSCYCINSQADDAEKEAAKEFLNWLFQSEEGKQIVMNEFLFVPAFTNYDGMEPQDSLSKTVKRYVDEDNTDPWVFTGCPEGFMDMFGEQVQAYVSDSVTWDELISTCQADWAAKKGN